MEKHGYKRDKKPGICDTKYNYNMPEFHFTIGQKEAEKEEEAGQEEWTRKESKREREREIVGGGGGAKSRSTQDKLQQFILDTTAIQVKPNMV